MEYINTVISMEVYLYLAFIWSLGCWLMPSKEVREAQRRFDRSYERHSALVRWQEAERAYEAWIEANPQKGIKEPEAVGLRDTCRKAR